MTHIPPPHPVRKRPIVAAPLAAADATGPDCTLSLAVQWDGTTVQRIDVTATYPEGVTPRYAVTVLGEGNITLDRTIGTTPTLTRVPDVGGPATGVAVRDEWGYGCTAWADPPEPEAVEPPAYTPVTPEPGDHRPETTTPTTEPGSRVLHSL